MRCASLRGNLLLAAAALVVACMPFYASPYHMQLASTAMIAAMFALSLQLLVGGAGMVSLAQAAFFTASCASARPEARGSTVALIGLPAGIGAATGAGLIGPFVTRGFLFFLRPPRPSDRCCSSSSTIHDGGGAMALSSAPILGFAVIGRNTAAGVLLSIWSCCRDTRGCGG
jgi:hypothetical protein